MVQHFNMRIINLSLNIIQDFVSHSSESERMLLHSGILCEKNNHALRICIRNYCVFWGQGCNLKTVCRRPAYYHYGIVDCVACIVRHCSVHTVVFYFLCCFVIVLIDKFASQETSSASCKFFGFTVIYEFSVYINGVSGCGVNMENVNEIPNIEKIL